MPTFGARAQVMFAGLPELDDIIAHPDPTDWPPPGTHVDYQGHSQWGEPTRLGGLNFDVVAAVGGALPEGFWWTTLAALLVDRAGWEEVWGPEVLALYLTIRPGWFGEVGAIPVYYRSGEGTFMRWIRTTYRGELGGGVEQFQFKIDLGNPGSDPDLDAAGCAALAEQLAGILISDGSGMYMSVAAAHKFTEVGAVTMTATDPTDAQGEGGNMEQSFPTEWYMYPTVSRPPGGTTGVSLPFEVACAVTLQTDHRGPSGRGRFYLPPFDTSAMAQGGIYVAANVDATLAGAVSFLEGIKADTPYVPVVVSPRRIILNEITSVNVGRVPDSQRRRRRSQDEARVSAVLA